MERAAPGNDTRQVAPYPDTLRVPALYAGEKRDLSLTL